MSAVQIAQNLAFINWTVLTGLALGSFGTVALLRRRSGATRGFLAFTSLCAVAFGILAFLSDGALPVSLGDSPVVADPAWDAPRRTALGAFVALIVIAAIARRAAPRFGPALDVATVAAGALVLGFGSLTWAATRWASRRCFWNLAC